MRRDNELTNKEISTIIEQAFRIPPENIAAYELHAKGVTEGDILDINMSIPYDLKVKVCNALRNIYYKK